MVVQGLPVELRAVARFLVGEKPDSDARRVAGLAEARRGVIARTSGTARIWYSPKPDQGFAPRPEPGAPLPIGWDRVARTGKDRMWATALYIMARSFNCRRGLELGACAGISAMYLAAIPTMERFVTVEGSAELASVARDSLRSFKRAEVIVGRFDEALDRFERTGETFDFAFIDGHHEQRATIHYFERLLPMLAPGALVLFDDIRWSEDMFAAWRRLRTRESLSHAIDLGHIGVGIMVGGPRSSGGAPLQWDLSFVADDLAISKPWGWTD